MCGLFYFFFFIFLIFFLFFLCVCVCVFFVCFSFSLPSALSWNKHFTSRTWPPSQTIFSQNMFATFVVGSVCLNLVLLEIWGFMTAISCKLCVMLSHQHGTVLNIIRCYISQIQNGPIVSYTKSLLFDCNISYSSCFPKHKR